MTDKIVRIQNISRTLTKRQIGYSRWLLKTWVSDHDGTLLGAYIEDHSKDKQFDEVVRDNETAALEWFPSASSVETLETNGIASKSLVA